MKELTFRLGILICALFLSIPISAQTNLLLNPNADYKTENWSVSKEATIEEFDGNRVFVVRNQGSFAQDVNLTNSDIGKFALLIGRGSSERINPDGAITGLPYLYGYMLGSSIQKVENTHLQGQKMLAEPAYPDQWIKMFGIFCVPEGTTSIRFFLNQAERKNVPQNGSAARFDNVGLYLFETEEDALRFVKMYK